MSKFRELFQAAIPEFDEEDQVVALAIGEFIDALKDDLADMQEVFPDLPAESITRPIGEAQDMLKLTHAREQAAQARGATKAEAFFAFVSDALLDGIEHATPD